MRSKLNRLWPLAAVLVAALAVTSVSGAGHDATNIFHLGVTNLPASPTTLQTSSSGRSLAVTNTNTTFAGRAIEATSSGTAGTISATNMASSGANAMTAVVASQTAGVGSNAVEGVNQGSGVGVRGTAFGANGIGVRGYAASTGVYGSADGTGASATGVFGLASAGTGVTGRHDDTTGTLPGVLGRTSSTEDLAAGVYGEAPNDGELVTGVRGSAASGIGLLGQGGNIGIVGIHPSGGLAGFFAGSVFVTGTIYKGGGAFRIDHPLEPQTKYLQHSFVESPDMKNVYDGVVTTDRRGFASVRLPRYFQALNRDFRYQLTPIGRRAWDARAGVWKEIEGNRFVIRSEPRTKISWQVTGTRKDRYANEHRIRVEVEKTAADGDTLRRVLRAG